MACTCHFALELNSRVQSYPRPLPNVVSIGVVRCCGDWHGGALLFFDHYVHTPLGTRVASYSRIRSSPQRYDFGVWHGCTRIPDISIACPAATLVVRRQFQLHIFDMTRVWRHSTTTYKWHDKNLHSPRGCHYRWGHGVVRIRGSFGGYAHRWTVHLSALRLPCHHR